MENQVIALFPLPLVLFPHSLYPLRIFEPRYQTLLDQCLRGREGFGIVPIIENKIIGYGCFAEVVTVKNTLPTGERDIIVKGKWRFSLEKSWTGKEGFILGVATPIPEPINDYATPALEKEIDESFRDILRKTEMILGVNFWHALKNSGLKSFKYAEKVGLSLYEQLELLRLDTEDERLNFIKNHISHLLNEVEGFVSLRKIIQSDGYLNEL